MCIGLQLAYVRRSTSKTGFDCLCIWRKIGRCDVIQPRYGTMIRELGVGIMDWHIPN